MAKASKLISTGFTEFQRLRAPRQRLGARVKRDLKTTLDLKETCPVLDSISQAISLRVSIFCLILKVLALESMSQTHIKVQLAITPP